jgi:hypothetical protein
MEREDFVRLAGSAGQALLAQIDYSSTTDVLALVAKLRSDGHDPATVAAVLTQAKLRKRGQAKFGEFASQMLFTEAGLEQASRLKLPPYTLAASELPASKKLPTSVAASGPSRWPWLR